MRGVVCAWQPALTLRIKGDAQWHALAVENVTAAAAVALPWDQVRPDAPLLPVNRKPVAALPGLAFTGVQLASASWRDRIEFAEVASYFETSEEAHLQLIDPSLGTLAYKDSDHLNRDGANRLEQLFRAKVFGQRLCNRTQVLRHLAGA
jgi:hypothetical protein